MELEAVQDVQAEIPKKMTIVNNQVDQSNDMAQENNSNEMILSWSSIIFNIICHLIICIFTSGIVYLSFANEIHVFSWHPSFMTIGYFLLMTEAILCFTDKNLLTNRFGYKNRVFIHWVLQVLANICITIAFVAIIISKFNRDKSHFVTYHAIVGLITIILSALAAANGVQAKYSYQLRQHIRPVYSKILHGLFGIGSHALAIICMIIGLYSNWFQNRSTPTVVYICIIFLLYVGIYAIYKPIISLTSRIIAGCFRSNL